MTSKGSPRSSNSQSGAVPLPKLVQTQDELQAVMRRAREEPAIALDTESNSLFAYHYRVCLIQLSIPGADYLLDPLTLTDLAPLGELLAAAHVQKVFHAAENDIIVLKRDFSFQFANIFDTQLAARILGWRSVGLAAILQQEFGVRTDKRMQRTDWGRRPLTTEQMGYAVLDTHYLLQLRQRLMAELRARRRMREAEEAFAQLPHVEYVEKAFDPDGFWQLAGARGLEPSELAILRELYIWREQLASRRDLPPFKIMTDQCLVNIATRSPRTAEDLGRIHGISKTQARRYFRQIHTAIQRASQAPPPQPRPARRDTTTRPDDATLMRYEALRAWRTARAQERGVDPDIVLTNDTLMQIARANPRTLAELDTCDHLAPWKLETYGPEILTVLERKS